VAVIHDSASLDLFSFVTGSGVGVYIRSSLVNLFTLVKHDAGGACIAFYDRGREVVVSWVYVRPGTKKDLFLELSKTWDCGNLNARHHS